MPHSAPLGQASDVTVLLKVTKTALVRLLLQWMETNQSNFRIYPMDIRLLPPNGTMLTAFADVKYKCSWMLDGLVSSHPCFCNLVFYCKRS
jgi:hypothetical protein